MNKGQRITESLRDPNSRDIAASQWLLLFTISANPGLNLSQIEEKLKKTWEEIHKKNPNFYIFLGGYGDAGHKWEHRKMDDVLIIHEEFEYIRVDRKNNRKNKGKQFFYITERGCKLLTSTLISDYWWPKLKDILSPLINTY